MFYHIIFVFCNILILHYDICIKNRFSSIFMLCLELKTDGLSVYYNINLNPTDLMKWNIKIDIIYSYWYKQQECHVFLNVQL